MPPPIASVAELAAAGASLLRNRADPLVFERFVAALPVFVRADRAAVSAALTPLLPEWTDSVVLMMRSAVTGVCRGYALNEYERNPAHLSHLTARRAVELAEQLAGEPPAALLATPATVDGHVDPVRVLDLVAAAEAAGTRPGPYDLTQALLRLPRVVEPRVAEAAARLRSPAGRALARWLAGGGLADPDIRIVDVPQQRCRHGNRFDEAYLPCGCGPTRAYRRTATFPLLTHPDLTLPPELLSRPPEHADGFHYVLSAVPWPLAAPSHRELVAAHLQPLLAGASDGSVRSDRGALLPSLARASGPLGPAFALCLAYGLTLGRPAERLAAADAFVITAARADLGGADVGALVGHELAALHDAGLLVLRRVAEALTGALRAGAAAEVWAAARALVPAALTASAGGPDLLALASAAASAVGAHETIPDLEDVALRGGRTRLVTEAGRLARTLAARP